jgi:hypothetical protein
MEPELGRDVTVAIVLIATIVALATGTVAFGAAVLGVAAALLGLVALIRSRAADSRPTDASRPGDPRSH